MQIDNENPVISRQVIEMITVAHEYCLFFEKAEKYEAQQIFDFFQKIAPLLYLKATMLPRDIEADPEFAERYVTEEQWENIFKTLRVKFADSDLYYILDENNDSQQHSLADNLADIYQDMKDFVMLYQKAPLQSKTWAVAELNNLFRYHWGKVLLQALNAVHIILFSNVESSDDLIDEDWDF
jgi:hypothetical protein